jgi:dienelactone hydrolase
VAKLMKKDREYAFAGLKMMGYSCISEGGPSMRPGVLIVHDAFGLDSHCMKAADRLAEAGFAAFAVDLWGNRRRFSSPAEVMGTLTALVNDPDTWMGRMEAARQVLIAEPNVDASRLAAIGYCFGGSTVLEFARRGGDLKGVVSLHGGLDYVGMDWSQNTVKAKLLVCTGVEDPIVPWDSLTTFKSNVRNADVNWEIDIYCRAKHSFTRTDAAIQSTPERAAYDAQADQRSWSAMLSFLHEVFYG